jgi:pimeloyl-ACP methyl ester carboxylesterase
MSNIKRTVYSLEHLITSQRGAGVLRIKPPIENAKQVIVLHGLESSKEWSLTTMYGLARAGFDTIGIDLFMHGDRPDASNRDDLLATDFIGAMRNIIYESASDVPKIVAELGVDFEQAGLLGISAGGFSGHVLMTQAQKPKVYVAAITSPDWLAISQDITSQIPAPIKAIFSNISPIGSFKKYPPSALLQIVGLQDERVRPEGAIDLHKRLEPIYESMGTAENLAIACYPDVAHYFTAEMLDETIAWFKKHL